jgi:hypothetical protein
MPNKTYSLGLRPTAPTVGLRAEDADVMACSTQHLRDVLCTSVFKSTGDAQQAAEAICDSVDVVRKHYRRYGL